MPPDDNPAAFGVYPHMLKRPEAHNDRIASANFPAEVAKALVPQDMVDVGLMAVPYGGALRKLGVGLAAAGLSGDAEAGALSRLFKAGAKGVTSRSEALMQQWVTEHPKEFTASVKKNLAERSRTANLDYELKQVPVGAVKPSQHGADYLNDSSIYTAKELARKNINTIHRKQDALPITLDAEGNIVDGNHRHAAAVLNGDETIPALVPVGKGSGEVLNLPTSNRWAPASQPQLEQPVESKLLQGMYRGYAGEGRGETVYHAGAEFKQPNAGLFTTPEKAAAERFQKTTAAPQLHSFEAKPRRTGTEEDVYRMAKRLGIYEPGVPAGQYLEQGENALFPESALMVEELRNQGLDSLKLFDGMSKTPSLVALDPSVLRRAPELFVTPQKRVADYYAQKRAAQTGEAPHAEMVLIDPATGRRYGHGTLGTGAQGPLRTLAAELKPEEVISTTNLYAQGGLVEPPLPAAEFSPLEMDYIIGNVTSGQHEPAYAEGGSVENKHIPYDEAKISSLVNALREELHA